MIEFIMIPLNTVSNSVHLHMTIIVIIILFVSKNLNVLQNRKAQKIKLVKTKEQ